MSDIAKLIFDHAREKPEEEVCGLVIARASKASIIRANNLHADKRRGFDLDPQAWLDVPEDAEVVGIYHSHPFDPARPSMVDLVSCEATGLPWHIVNPSTGDYHYFEPSGYKAPLLQRPYVHGVMDCYTLIRDWYLYERQIVLKNYKREDDWWHKGQNLYVDYFQDAGFEQLPPESTLIEGDVLLIQVSSNVPNHAAVYLEGGKIIHHVGSRLSKIDVYGGYWERHMTHHLRYKDSNG